MLKNSAADHIGGSRVHSSDASGCALGPGVRHTVSAKSLVPACWPATIGFMPSPVAEGRLPCRGWPDRGGPLPLGPCCWWCMVSHQGRGVVDMASGNVLARDRQETRPGLMRRAGPRWGSARWTARGSASAAAPAVTFPARRRTAGRPVHQVMA